MPLDRQKVGATTGLTSTLQFPIVGHIKMYQTAKTPWKLMTNQIWVESLDSYRGDSGSWGIIEEEGSEPRVFGLLVAMDDTGGMSIFSPIEPIFAAYGLRLEQPGVSEVRRA